jgi:tensin
MLDINQEEHYIIGRIKKVYIPLYSCYNSFFNREIALDVLRNEPIGSFIVRESTTKSGCFALSLRVPKDHQPCGIAHYLILKTSRGYKIKVRLSYIIVPNSLTGLKSPMALSRYGLKMPTTEHLNQNEL